MSFASFISVEFKSMPSNSALMGNRNGIHGRQRSRRLSSTLRVLLVKGQTAAPDDARPALGSMTAIRQREKFEPHLPLRRLSRGQHHHAGIGIFGPLPPERIG